MTKSFLLAGVGGQGTILTSKILTEGLTRLGFDIKMSEIHGMAQRGGTVTTHIKFGEKVYSPIITSGEADVILAFEKLEAARHLSYLKPGGTLIVNDYEIYPMPVLTGQVEYTEEILDILKSTVPNTVVINAYDIAKNAGSVRAQNIVLLGAAVKILGITDLDWEQIIKSYLPEKFHEMNIKAFNAGMQEA